LDKIGRYTNHSIVQNATTVSVREGSEAQFVNIRMTTDDGDILNCNNAMGAFMQDEDVPWSERKDAIDASVGYRSSLMMSQLLFGGSYVSTVSDTVSLGQLSNETVYPVVSNSGATSAAVGLVKHTLTGTTPEYLGWKATNTSLLKKVSNRPTIMTITADYKVTVAGSAGCKFVAEYYINGVLVGTSIEHAGDSLAIFTTVTLLNAGVLALIPVGEYSGPEVRIRNSTLGSSGSTLVVHDYWASSTTVGSIFIDSYGAYTTQTEYISPQSFTHYGKPTDWCMCDDLTHQIDLIY
jgi:hypothetical protein